MKIWVPILISTFGVAAAAGYAVGVNIDDGSNERRDEPSAIWSVDAEGGQFRVSDDPDTEGARIEIGGVGLDLPMAEDMFDADDFTIGGVEHFPGTRIVGVDINAGQRGGRAPRVSADFDYPAPAEAVADHYQNALSEEGMRLDRQGTVITARGEGYEAFRLEISPDGEEASIGRLTIVEDGGG